MLLQGVRNEAMYDGGIDLHYFPALWMLRGCSAPPSPVLAAIAMGTASVASVRHDAAHYHIERFL